MTDSKLEEVQKKLTIRNIESEDLDEIAALSKLSFGPDISFKRKHFVSQLETFPEGQVCIEYEGEIVGNASSLMINYHDYGKNHSYAEICDEGFIGNHNPKGINLYGIEVSVHPDYRGMKIGRYLYGMRRTICKKLNLKSIIIGGRIPYYHKYADQMSASKYAQKVIDGELYDPVLTFQAKNGFVLHDVIPDYLPDDHASMKFATSMEWINPDYIA